MKFKSLALLPFLIVAVTACGTAGTGIDTSKDKDVNTDTTTTEVDPCAGSYLDKLDETGKNVVEKSTELKDDALKGVVDLKDGAVEIKDGVVDEGKKVLDTLPKSE